MIFLKKIKNDVGTSFFERGSDAKPLEEGPVSFERVCGSTVKISLQVSSEKERQLPRKKNYSGRESCKSRRNVRRLRGRTKKQAQADSAAISTPHIKRKRSKKRQLEQQEEEEVT
jgi:hypothetical protein